MRIRNYELRIAGLVGTDRRAVRTAMPDGPAVRPYQPGRPADGAAHRPYHGGEPLNHRDAKGTEKDNSITRTRTRTNTEVHGAAHEASRFAFHVSRFTHTFHSAFTLIEILITVGLLSFIIIGLLAMFNQTQRAFMSSMHGTDVLESGRLFTDMVARDIEQMVPAVPPLYAGNIATNFMAENSRLFYPAAPAPWTQGLAGTGPAVGPQLQRTNYVQDIFFVSKNNDDWYGTGYAVVPTTNTASGVGIGTLYRFSYPVPRFGISNDLAYASLWFRYACSNAYTYMQTNGVMPNIINTGPVPHWDPSSGRVGNGLGWGYATRIADGIAHLRVNTFARNGYPIVSSFFPDPRGSPGNYITNGLYDAFFRTNGLGDAYGYDTVNQALIVTSQNSPLPDNVYFWSNAVPASVELELGVVEPQIYKRYQAIGDYNQIGQRNYLSNRVANIHIFRQRIPIRGVDFLAYQ